MKPKTPPDGDFPPDPDSLHRVGDWLWLPLKREWRDVAAKPEEVVRQRFIRILHDKHGYALVQMAQERKTQSGTRSPRADILVWETPAKLTANASPALVIECKSEAVAISLKDYWQGESYARAVGAEMFVAHNQRYTSVFQVVPKAPGEFVELADLPGAADWADVKKLAELKGRQRAFNKREFQDLLFRCHSILRDVHKMDPGRAFDTISKILFVKMFVERSGQHGVFSTQFIDERKKRLLQGEPSVHETLFIQTKTFYSADDLFAAGDALDVSEATFRRIVKLLERFDLSKTSDDVKGVAFEQFLGQTFRGELGQYFTPRPVVNFVVDALDPKEGELICDPAAGSGGFLIRVFEHVRDAIRADVDGCKDEERAGIEAGAGSADDKVGAIEARFAELNRDLLPSGDGNQPVDTRMGRLAWKCIFGTDAEPRAARTAKMNMIMHGDGHGGVHFHDGLVDVNGVFAGRFDVVVTNPPFGSTVDRHQRIGETQETRVDIDADRRGRYRDLYGEAWKINHDRLLARALEATLSQGAAAVEMQARRALAAELKRIDAAHDAALWAQVRAASDYPVFVAAPAAVGISSTGETGAHVPDDLPAVLAAWRAFDAWRKAGGAEDQQPSFAA